MKITKSIEIDVKKKGTNFIASDIITVQMLLGTTEVSGNHNYYGIKKDGDKYYVPIEVVKERIQKLEERKVKIENDLEIMKQFVRGVKNGKV